MMAISQILQELVLMQDTEVEDTKPTEYSKRMLVLSLGTGSAKQKEKYSAATASKWGLLHWLYDKGDTPLLDIIGDASADMAEFHVSTLFHAVDCKNNYLRIQAPNDKNDDTLRSISSYLF